MTEAVRDQNHIAVALGVSSANPAVTLPFKIDSVTGRLLTDSAAGAGTVSSVSVVTANGFAGTVADPTTTPAITLQTTVTGILKGNGTAISAAVANTDYQSPIALTTTGTSGAATFNGTTINIPQYQAAGTYVTSVSGTANRITSSGGTTPVIDISASYVGQASITTLGTITTGVWNAGAVTSSGLVTGTAFVPTGSSVPTNGLYLPAANTLGWAINSAAEMQLTSTALSPAADGGSSLGTTALGWQNLFANTGFVLNIEGGNWVATHTSAILTVGTGDLRVSNAGTNSESVVTNAGTQTLTNKRITDRITSISSSGTPTINTDNCDAVTITALAANITSMTTNLSGTPTNFQKLIFRIKDNGSARTISWGASFAAMGVALPTTTVISKVLIVGFIYDSVAAVWGCVASAQEA